MSDDLEKLTEHTLSTDSIRTESVEWGSLFRMALPFIIRLLEGLAKLPPVYQGVITQHLVSGGYDNSEEAVDAALEKLHQLQQEYGPDAPVS